MKAFLLVVLAVLVAVTRGRAEEPLRLLNVSYDVSREFYKEYDAAFARHWRETTGREITIDVSHGGSSKQARAVADGLEADVVTMNQETDINLLARSSLVAHDWRGNFPNNSSPYTSTIVFLVRKGNPKGITDWADLAKPGTGVIVPNPKTSGNGRYAYLAAWAWAQSSSDGDAKTARAFVEKLFRNVPVLETGGRAATTTFIKRRIGDVLLTFESEVLQITRHFNPDDFEVVVPSTSIEAEFPVAVVEKVADKRGTREAAADYLRYLWSEEGQRLAAKHYYRPRRPDAAPAGLFPAIKLFKVDEIFGGWSQAQRIHFDDGGEFDDVTAPASLRSIE
jgi:sulfate/thiosulfate-binding protein